MVWLMVNWWLMVSGWLLQMVWLMGAGGMQIVAEQLVKSQIVAAIFSLPIALACFLVPLTYTVLTCIVLCL